MNNIMNEVEIENRIKKITMYQKSESLMLNKLTENFNNLKNYYLSSNQENMTNIFFEIEKKMKIAQNNHNALITVLNKNLTKYQNTSKEVATMFNNIEYK